jgi:hypothetical protein
LHKLQFLYKLKKRNIFKVFSGTYDLKMAEPAIYRKSTENGAHGVFAVGVGNQLGVDLLRELDQINMYPTFDKSDLIESLTITGENEGQRHFGTASIDHSTAASPERVGEVYLIHGDPELELLQRINVVSLAASTEEELDDVFQKVATAANFNPEEKYQGMGEVADIALDELLTSYEGSAVQQETFGQASFHKDYFQKLKILRENVILQRTRAALR